MRYNISSTTGLITGSESLIDSTTGYTTLNVLDLYVTSINSLVALLVGSSSLALSPNNVYLTTLQLGLATATISYQAILPFITVVGSSQGIFPSRLFSATKFYLVGSLNRL